MKQNNHMAYKIIIYQNADTAQQKIEIDDPDKIKDILLMINDKKQDPWKFIPEYKVAIFYSDSTLNKTFLIKDNLLNIEGVTYKTQKNISKELHSFFGCNASQ